MYIERCNRAPCGDTQIVLFQGADSSKLQEAHPDLMTFLKGSSKTKTKLKKEKAELYAQFEKIWAVREWHVVKELPSQYIYFFLYQATEVIARIQCARMVNPHLQLLGLKVADQ